jgi:hypothetical protein
MVLLTVTILIQIWESEGSETDGRAELFISQDLMISASGRVPTRSSPKLGLEFELVTELPRIAQ